MQSLFRDLRPLFPIVQTVFFQRVTYTTKEEPTSFSKYLQWSSGYPTTYALSSYYNLRSDFSFRKDEFQSAVKEYEGVERNLVRYLSEEEKTRVNRVLAHWKIYGDNDANDYSHIVLERQQSPVLIIKNRDLAPSIQNRCKVIQLDSLESFLAAEKALAEREERAKNRFIMLGVLGAFIGLSNTLN